MPVRQDPVRKDFASELTDGLSCRKLTASKAHGGHTVRALSLVKDQKYELSYSTHKGLSGSVPEQLYSCNGSNRRRFPMWTGPFGALLPGFVPGLFRKSGFRTFMIRRVCDSTKLRAPLQTLRAFRLPPEHTADSRAQTYSVSGKHINLFDCCRSIDGHHENVL
jgi:hypothetical protein